MPPPVTGPLPACKSKLLSCNLQPLNATGCVQSVLEAAEDESRAWRGLKTAAPLPAITAMCGWLGCDGRHSAWLRFCLCRCGGGLLIAGCMLVAGTDIPCRHSARPVQTIGSFLPDVGRRGGRCFLPSFSDLLDWQPIPTATSSASQWASPRRLRPPLSPPSLQWPGNASAGQRGRP